MNDCYYDRKDWRSCKEAVRLVPFSRFLLIINRPLLYLVKALGSCILMAVIYIDGTLSEMLEDQGQRSEDGN